jgi:hypothetical protein
MNISEVTHSKQWGTRILRKLMLLFFITLLFLGCVAIGRTRQFVIMDEELKKKPIGKWIVEKPELIAYKNYRNVGNIPIDTLSFRSIVKIKKPENNELLKERIFLDSIIINFFDSETRIVRIPYTTKHVLSMDMDEERYEYYCLIKDDEIYIPMEIDSLDFALSIRILDKQDNLLDSKIISFKMIRQEKKRIGITYGD